MPPAPDAEATDETTEDDIDATLEGRRLRRQRLITAVRAVLAGSVVALGAAIVLFLVWHSGIKGVGGVAFSRSWRRCGLLIMMWVVGAAMWPAPYYRLTSTRRLLKRIITGLKLLPLAGVAACTAYACLPVFNLWQETASTYGVRLGELLAYMMGIATVGLIAMAHICLRAVRSAFDPTADPSWDELTDEVPDLQLPWLAGGAPPWRHLHLDDFLPLSPGIAALMLLPAAVLTAGFSAPYLTVKGTHPAGPTVTQATASDIEATRLPGYPTSFGTQKPWVKDIDGFVDIAGGAAGPILLTNDTITGINPDDGSARWQYHRAGSQFHTWMQEDDPVASGDLGLITSPNGRYVAVVAIDPMIYSSMSSKTEYLDGEAPMTTIVLDAVTGKVVLTHPHSVGDYGETFQLSDSALLEGTIAYSLNDGSQMWDLRKLHLDGDISTSSDTMYSGTAGHASFIIRQNDNGDALTVVSQSDPSHPKKVIGTLHKHESNEIVTARGWIGVYDDRTPENPKEDKPKARRAHAVSLDALSEAPGADTRTFDLGSTLGINAPASLSTDTLSVLPTSTPDGKIPEYRNIEDPSTWKGSSSVSTIFNPATMTVTPLKQTPHYVSAAGITTTNPKNGKPAVTTTHHLEATTGDGQITIKTGDGNIIPVCDIEPGSTHSPPLSYNSSLEDFASHHYSPRHISALSTPGATITILNNSPEYVRSSHSFRLYGIPG